MVAYIIVLCAVFCFALQFAFTKVYEQNTKQTVITSLVMLIIAGTVGALIYFVIGGFNVSWSPISFFLAAVFVIIMIPYYVISVKILSLGSLAIYSMFMMLGGMLLPFIYGIAFLKEDVSAGKIIGCILLSVFIVLQAFGQNQENTKAKNKYLFFILCICIFVINGLTGVVAALHQSQENAIDEMSFIVISCALTVILSTIVLILVLVLNSKTENEGEIKSVFKLKSFVSVVGIGVAMHTGNYLILKAATQIPASVQFPLISGGTIVFSTVVSVLWFKEKLSKKEFICILGAFSSTVLFAF